ncbi:MAG TPA: hypothetical protein VG796_00860 [Verrucomicrobiales bacterium]|jgi:hypothetical protein|nr:hypothetical protein [Verrucomicrobiales bacterium]
MNGEPSAFFPKPPQYDPDYWSQRFSSEPYLQEGDRFEDFEPAYRFGHSLRGEADDFDLHEEAWEQRWNAVKEGCRLTWERAKKAIRAAWRHAEAEVSLAQSKLEAVADRGEEKLSQAFHRWEDNVRRYPSEYVLGAAAAGFVASRLPVRSLLLSGIGLVAAAAPPALLLMGIYKAADCFLHGCGSKQGTSNARAAALPPDIAAAEI